MLSCTIFQDLEKKLSSAAVYTRDTKAAVQKLSFYRDDVLDKKQAIVHANMVITTFEERERSLIAYHRTVRKQYERAYQFYEDIAKFEDWYPEIERQLDGDFAPSRDAESLKSTLQGFEVRISVL